MKSRTAGGGEIQGRDWKFLSASCVKFEASALVTCSQSLLMFSDIFSDLNFPEAAVCVVVMELLCLISVVISSDIPLFI